ncbi:MAG TPA: YceI family protein [Thermoanaerobaculia bacterium]|nr:YceI family protein [Thermoanaerobaculia bacterium]
MRRNPRFALVLALLAAAALPALAEIETFNFDKAHTQVGFRIRHFVSKVEGRFNKFDGTILLDRQNPGASKVDLTIQADSIDTNNENRDKDLRSENFFDVAKFPTITFKSTKVVAKGNDAYDVTGDFTMHGVTKTITVPVKHTGFLKVPGRSGMGEKAGFEITFPLNRKDYGITWNRALDAGGTMLSDDVDISVQVEANKQMPEAPKAPAPAAPAPTPAKS